AWGAFQQRHYLAAPNLSQRIVTSAAARRFLLRRQPWILFDAIGGGGAEPGLGRGKVGVSVWRKLIYSLIWQSVMWRPGKLRFLIGVKKPSPIRPAVTARKHGPLQGRAVARFATSVGLRPPFVTHPATLPHPDRRALFILFAAQQRPQPDR